MTQPTQTLESFFSGGGGKSVSWKDKPIGTTVSGTIKAVNPPQQVTDPATKELKFNKAGKPVTQVRIDLATNLRDPEDPQDDGSRALYVGGWMTGAVGDALRKVGRDGPPEVGGQLSVTLTERTPNENPALQPVNKFVASYVSPATAATGQFFAAGQQAGQQFAAAVPPAMANGGYPAASPIQAVAPVQPVAPQPQYAPPIPVAVQAEPARPDAISEGAWNAMDLGTKISVAATMAGVPPF